MTPNQILKDAEADLAALAGLPGEIRAKVKAGIAELSRLRDAIDATIAAMTGQARTTLASLQALASAGQEPDDTAAAEGRTSGADVPVADGQASDGTAPAAATGSFGG